MTEHLLTPDRINSLITARQQSYAAFQRYRALLSAEAAKLGIDADWLDDLVRSSLHSDFIRRAKAGLEEDSGPTT